jgi:molecular chaperone DnaK
LSDAEIEKMKEEAKKNAEADKQAKEKVEKINSADTLIFQTEKQMKEFGDKIPEEKKAPINEALSELKEAHSSEDLDKIDGAMEKLNNAWQEASQEIYQAQQEAGGAGAQAGAQAEGSASDEESSEDEDVTDVEFEEVDEDQS